jgi:hypothetical protein
MAEFKLGRIRFIWKGDWIPTTIYYKDDIIRNGGNTYICVQGHTSPLLFTTEQDIYWNKISDGTEWKGNWRTGIYYKENDVVKYGGYLYIANTAHTSADNVADGLEVELGSDSTSAKWDLFAEGFDYKANWTTSFRYKINDIVKYNGTVYLCTVDHNSAGTEAGGLEQDQSNWDIFSEGFYWQGIWDTDFRYRKKDIVKYGGQVYVCNEGHTSALDAADGLEFDQTKWDYFHKGVEYNGDWASATRYKINDLVKFGGGIWICTEYHTSQSFLTDDESKWAQFVEGLEFEDSWSGTVRYQHGDFVTYGGYSYVAITNNLGSRPTENPADWDLFTTGFRFVGDWGEDSSNFEYFVGDVVRITGYTYLCILDHTGQRPPEETYWQRLNSGIYWKSDWVDATYYDLGDAVHHGVNSYICVLAHTSDEIVLLNRPDQDVTGINWNLLSGGPEAGNLTTEGDLVYYGGAGPARLPIGAPGQVLKVNDIGNAPEWGYFGATNHVYYVETTNGVDAPAPSYGVTIDRPFKTVRYAAEQIEKGALRPNASRLLELNRSFMAAEANAWKDAQIAGNTGIWNGFVDPAPGKCERDMGQIIDALLWDLSHGGNIRTRAAVYSYFNGASLLPVIAAEDVQTVAVIEYLVEVIDAVLTNFDPAASYQGTITQVKDVLLVEETDAQALVETLVAVITSAITNDTVAAVPVARNPNNSIFVKTGVFAEVLPIIVPADTAIIGDELRSTKITPAGSLVDNTDTPYTLDAITRLKAIIPDIIQNSAVSKTTTGASPNTETQVTTRPAGSAGSSTSVASIVANTEEMIDIITNGVANADALVFTDSGVAAKTTARTELQADRATIISDLIAWITSTYPSLTYDQTKCERDTGYIVDALSYDIQYGGNSATLIAARAYLAGAVAVLPAGQTTETAAALNQLSVIVASYLSGATEETEADGLLQIIEDVVTAESIAGLPAEVTPVITWASADFQTAHAALIASKVEIQSDSVQYVKANFSGLVFDQTICSRDIGLMVDALAYDLAFGSNYRSITAALAYYRGTASAQIVLSEQLNAMIAVTRFLKHKAKAIASIGAAALAETTLQDIYDYIDFAVNATSDKPAIFGSENLNTSTDYTYGVETLDANRDFIIAEIIAYIADAWPAHIYDETACSRDVSRYIDALKFDLIYTGNYKSTLAARYYSNAVNGSLLEDMFYLRNGTGLRNCTVSGLSGVLGAPNTFGTSRPTAGAFVSLDPGWGPNDSRAWIANKSPYVQNVTTFGTGCIGQKIDGDLHNGGNDSIVSNDFTQIISDGIGAWVTNLGRAELVSVFSYYNHIGYLAENGGKIRATNGNNSYGDFGAVAEGVDATEIPITGAVNNYSFDAIVYSVYTNGNEVLALEYLNAGVNYTDSATSIKTVTVTAGVDGVRTAGTYFNVAGTTSGTGTGQEFTIIVGVTGIVEVFEITNGGDGHVLSDVITIAASDIGGTGTGFTINVAEVGFATDVIVTGEGFGVAVDSPQVVDGGVFEVRLLETIVDPSNFGGAGYITNANVAQGGTSTQITISNTDSRIDSQYIGMAIYITIGVGAGQYGYIDTFNSGTKIATIKKFSDDTAGWDHVVPGTAIESILNDTTNYSIEPRLIFTAPGSSLWADTTKGRAYVEDGKIIRITILDPGVGYVSAPTMTVVDPNNSVEVPHLVRIGNGVLTQPTWTNRGNAMATAQAEIIGYGYADLFQSGTYIQVDGLTEAPKAGSNVEFAGLPDQYFKLVSVTQLLGEGPFTARLQISPEMTITDAPEHGEEVSMRIRYSQVRLTGHDFLDIGTGGFEDTNYPNIPLYQPTPATEINNLGGGRVFYTSTDQDGNFRVGGLFNVEQATGVATLNADAFNISGLQELQLGAVELGGTGAVITEFSTDGTFTANSDNIVPTQKAIKTYIASQIGGGAGELNVNTVTAGVIKISTNEITTITDVQINALQKINFTKGIDGHPLAMNYYLQS